MAEKLTLQQKLLQIRRLMPKIEKERHSLEVKYKFARLDDLWQALCPLMNEFGVNFHILEEKNVEVEKELVKTRYGERLLFVYRADLDVIWINADDPDDNLKATIHVIGWNDDPAKAKGAALTYALKYYMFNVFSVDFNADDPDSQDYQEENRGTHNRHTRPTQRSASDNINSNTSTRNANHNDQNDQEQNDQEQNDQDGLKEIEVIIGSKGSHWNTNNGIKVFRTAMEPQTKKIYWLLGWSDEAAAVLQEVSPKTLMKVTILDRPPMTLDSIAKNKPAHAPELPTGVMDNDYPVLLVISACY